MAEKKQPTSPTTPGVSKKELEQLLKRVQADFDNYRKRVEQEKQDIRQFANAMLLLDLLPVLDNFQRAAQHVPNHLENDGWLKGIRAIERQFEEILKRNGLEPIETKPGDRFDPTHHEAVSPGTGDGKEASTISRVVEQGYRFAGKVLRPAKVVVG